MIQPRSLLLGSALALSLCACGGGGGGSGPAPSVRLTGEAADLLGSGSDDFTTMAAKLTEALADDPTNQAAQVLLASVVALEFFKQSLAAASGPNAAPGDLKSLLERSGVEVVQSGNFWSTHLRLENHNQGHIKDSFPPAYAWIEFLERDLLPVLRDWIAALDAVPDDFEYRMTISSMSDLFQKPGDRTFVVDAGDLRALSFALGLARSAIALVTSYETQNLSLNDLDTGDGPDIDPLAVLETKYPNAGKLRPENRLGDLRTSLQAAWKSYLSASDLIRNESPERQARGILTLGRNTFASAEELQKFLQDEAGFRKWGDGLAAALSQSGPYTIPSEPNGKDIPVANRPTISFARFFQGVSFRDVMFKTIVDPLTGKKTLGVASLDELTPQMASLGGILLRLHGRALAAGDLQQRYAVRVTPRAQDKSVDGNLRDWSESDDVLIAVSPQGSIKSPYPDLGNLRGARGVTDENLYLYLDSDPIKYMVERSDWYRLTVRGNGGYAQLTYRTGFGDRTLSSQTDPRWVRAGPPGGLEIEIPLANFPNDDWVEIELSVYADSRFFAIDSTRRMFVDIRAP